MEFHCYRCGQPGHVKAECPQDRAVPAAAPPSGQATGTRRVEDKPVPVPRSVTERAQYGDTHPLADELRARMGWQDRSEDEKRALAAEQVTEARVSRTVLG